MKDLRTLLAELGIPYRLGGQHRNVREGFIGLDCPFCGTWDKFHLGIAIGSSVATCWSCGKHPLAEVLHVLTDRPWQECQTLVRSTARYRPLADAVSRPEPSVRVTIPDGVGPLGKAHRRYLEQRGFDPDELVRIWGLRGIGLWGGMLSWRIWIPVMQGGQLVTWVARAIGKDAEPRYRSASAVAIKSVLFGEDYCQDVVIVVEGPLDAMRIGPGAVATFGIGWSEAQARRLQRYRRRVLVFDREPAAQASAGRLAKRLAGFPGETIIVCLDAADPGCAEADEISAIRGLAYGRVEV
jgi:hypothetical protein